MFYKKRCTVVAT